MSTRDRRFRDLSLVLAAACLSLVWAEIVIRYVDHAQGPEISPGGNQPRGLFVTDSLSGYSLCPKFAGQMINAYGDFSVPVRINRQGNRGRDEPISSESLLFLGLGDSFTYGEGVDVDSTYLARVERDLEARSGRSICMVSAGVPGYSARQMLSRFHSILGVMTPSFVILGLTPGGGDRLDDPYVVFAGYIVRSSYRPRLEVVSDQIVETVSAPKAVRFFDSRAKAHSHLYRRVTMLGKGVLGRGSSCVGLDPYAEVRASRCEAWADSMRSIVREFALVCDEINAHALVLLVDATPTQEQTVISTLTAVGLPFVRLESPLNSYHCRTGESLVFEHDDHWNSQGHRVVADLVVERILREGWLEANDTKRAIPRQAIASAAAK